MKASYLDTSFLTAILLEEVGWKKYSKVLESQSAIFSSPLLEAEIRSVLTREKAASLPLEEYLAAISWFMDPLPLTPELKIILSRGYLRGADVFHVATALRIAGTKTHELLFLSVDDSQLEMADKCGFALL